jgi:hypothetical protein
MSFILSRANPIAPIHSGKTLKYGTTPLFPPKEFSPVQNPAGTQRSYRP